MRIFYDNKGDSVNRIQTFGSDDVGTFFPLNIQNELPGKIWRFTDDDLGGVTFEWGLTQVTASAFILSHHTILAGDSNLRIRGGDGVTWNVDEALTWAAGPILKTFNSATEGTWWFSFTPADTNSRDIGRMFLGPFHETEKQPDYNGFSRSRSDNAIKAATPAGQIYAQNRPSPRTFEISFDAVSDVEASALRAFVDAVGTHTAFYIQVDPSAPAGSELSEIIYCKLRRLPSFDVAGMDDALTWNVDFDLIEIL